METTIQNPGGIIKPPENLVHYKPSIIVLSGPPLTGKTTLANILASKSDNLGVIDVDEIRGEIDDARKLDPSQRWLPPEQELTIMIESYTILCERALEVSTAGQPVVITGTFSRDEFKAPLEKVVRQAKVKNIPVRAFLLTVTDQEAEKRIKKRQKEGSTSNVNTLEKYQWSKSIFSPITFTPIIEINTEDSTHVDQIAEHLANLKPD